MSIYRCIGRRFIHYSRLNSVSRDDISHFSKILSPTSILSTLPPFSHPPTDLAQFNNDWMGKYSGQASTVLKPKSTAEVSKIVKWCSEKRIGIVPQGGNTGLVGGSIPVANELVLSLTNMNKVRSFDPVSGGTPSLSLLVCYLTLRSRDFGRGCRLCPPISNRLYCTT